MINKNEENAFYLGMAAGNVFIDNIEEFTKEFISRYETSDPGFLNTFYIEGFLKKLRNELDIETLVWQKAVDAEDGKDT